MVSPPQDVRMLGTLGGVLESPDAYPWDGALFLPADEDWCSSTGCAVIRDEITLYESDNHPFAVEQGMSLALDVATVQDIVQNARMQLSQPSMEQLLSAFLYYYENDAFIEFDRVGKDA